MLNLLTALEDKNYSARKFSRSKFIQEKIIVPKLRPSIAQLNAKACPSTIKWGIHEKINGDKIPGNIYNGEKSGPHKMPVQNFPATNSEGIKFTGEQQA